MEILQTKRGESFGVLLATMCDTANTSVSVEWPVYPTRRVSSFPVSMIARFQMLISGQSWQLPWTEAALPFLSPKNTVYSDHEARK